MKALYTQTSIICKLKKAFFEIFSEEGKGFDVTTKKGLQKALLWLETTNPDNLMYGEPTGDPFDIQMGKLRRGMLIESVKAKLQSMI